MSYKPKPISLTTTRQTLTTAHGLSAPVTIRQWDIILLTGSETGYHGPVTVDNAGANAGGKFTSSIGYSIVPNAQPNTAVTTDDIYVVATGTCIGLSTVID